LKLLVAGAGIVLGQAVLYGPSLMGQKVLLPLDILAQSGVYIPPTPETAKIVPHDTLCATWSINLNRSGNLRFQKFTRAVSPCGRHFNTGVFLRVAKILAVLLLECCTRSPGILAWVQLFAALVAGTGIVFLLPAIVNGGFWPATVCAGVIL